ncbi:MAG: pantoate--beta-alanine ligase [Gammaproteobacteria bacterium]|jgi:pantoate--beta-alanine ligase
MEIIFDLKGLRGAVSGWKNQSNSIALVPTMGNLHLGHLSLIEGAKDKADRTVVSIFVNPIQFGHGEDYELYPSTLEQDLDILRDAHVDLVFAPNLGELYPAGIEADTRITVPDISDILCGEFRPGHFSGVATVVMKLFINVQPDYAFFGEKDYQQTLVIKRMVSDLLLPVKVLTLPIIREDNGLAMSSRNSYLNESQKQLSSEIYKAIEKAATMVRTRADSFDGIEKSSVDRLEGLGFKVEYFSIRRRQDLKLVNDGVDKSLIILVAAWIGDTRLIDNLQVDI